MKLRSTTPYRLATLLVGLTFLLTGPSPAQSVVDEYVAIGLANNQAYLREQLDTRIADENQAVAHGRLSPDVSFQANYTLAGGGRLIDIPAGDLVNPTNTVVNQLAGENTLPTNVPNVSEQLLPDNFHETKVRIIQPILNTDIYYGYKARQAQVSVSEAKEKAYRNQLEFEIRKAYYDHLKLLEQRAILDSTRQVLKELVRVNGKRVKYDVATPDAVYNAEAQLYALDTRLATNRKEINTSRNFFNFLLNRELEAEIIVDETTLNEAEIFDLQALKQDALARRSELSQLRSGITASDYEIKRRKGYLIPDLAVAGEVGYQGFGYTFDDEQDYYLVSFNLSWPLFQGGGNRANIRKAHYEKQQLEAELADLKKRIQLEVADAYYAYQEAQEVFQLRAAELASARENFRITAGKYRQNQVLLVEYNDARTQLTSAQLNESIARYNIKIAKANLHRVTQIDRS